MDAAASFLGADDAARSAAVRRPLLLGESPSEQGDRFHAFPLSGSPAKYLVQAAHLPHEGGPYYWSLVEHFETRNALRRYPRSGRWDAGEAARQWGEFLQEERIIEEHRKPDGPPFVVVCVGRKAAAAVGVVGDQPWFEWLEGTRLNSHFCVVPHTSGRNRIQNDPETRTRTGAVLREAIIRAGRPLP